jgi:Putative DNA-binding domain
VTFFGVPWPELDLEHVESFLANAGGEPLLWESKGTDFPRPDSIAKHVCGFANAIDGGYLLLGFERVGDQWKASGFDFPGDDPPVWVSDVVGTLRPRPRIDVRDWRTAKKRAAVVRVAPAAEPPCMTRGGQVFERVSGATIPVRDPGDLRRLYARGEAASAQAEVSALAAAAFVETLEPSAPPYLVIGLGLSQVGHPPDISSRLFTPSFVEKVINQVNAMPVEPLFFEDGPRGATVYPQQSAVVATTTGETQQTWRIRAAWDGSVAAFLTVVPEEEHEGRIYADVLFEAGVEPLARVVSELASVLESYGRGHIVLRVLARSFKISFATRVHTLPGPNTIAPIRRWTESDPAITEQHVESMKRELLRACQLPVWEPEA